MGSEPGNWFVRDDFDVVGPITEAAMRKRVMASSSPTLFVRQGESDWHAADAIRLKFAELAANGIYVKFDGVPQGPFTFTRAYEILVSAPTNGTEVRTGVSGVWLPAEVWLGKVHELKRQRAALTEPAIPVEMESEPELETMSAAARAAASMRKTFHLADNSKQPISPRSKWAIGVCLAVIGFGFVAWVNIRGYQRRHLSAIYTIDAGYGNWQRPPIDPAREVTAAPLKVVAGMLFRPTFDTTLGIVNGGTAFAAKVPQREGMLILSSLQLLGPAGGLKSVATAQQCKSLTLTDCLAGPPAVVVPMQPITLTKSAAFPEYSVHGDVLIAIVPENALGTSPALSLSPEIPKLGDPVWLVADVIKHDSLSHRARVLSIEDDWIVYAFETPVLALQATNGAPVMNASGDVIAIHSGGGEDHGRTIGVGSPVAKFLDYLLTEL